jgi:hypothetical protein
MRNLEQPRPLVNRPWPYMQPLADVLDQQVWARSHAASPCRRGTVNPAMRIDAASALGLKLRAYAVRTDSGLSPCATRPVARAGNRLMPSPLRGAR